MSCKFIKTKRFRHMFVLTPMFDPYQAFRVNDSHDGIRSSLSRLLHIHFKFKLSIFQFETETNGDCGFKAANKLMTKGGNNIRTVGLQISNKNL